MLGVRDHAISPGGLIAWHHVVPRNRSVEGLGLFYYAISPGGLVAWHHVVPRNKSAEGLFFCCLEFLIKAEVFELLDLVRCQINLFGSQLLVYCTCGHIMAAIVVREEPGNEGVVGVHADE